MTPSVDLSRLNLVNRPWGWLGPDVTLVRMRVEGIPERERLPALVAKTLLLNDPRNGVDFVSGHIEFGRNLDIW